MSLRPRKDPPNSQRKKPLTQKELDKLQEQNRKKLDYLEQHPEVIEKAAKKKYGKSWRIIYANEKHPKSPSVWVEPLLDEIEKSNERHKEHNELMKRIKDRI